MKSRILFVRCETTLVRALQERKTAEQRRYPGRRISIADVVRTLLYEALYETGASA